jgi:transcriptional regulator with XRE-family HTH domain
MAKEKNTLGTLIRQVRKQNGWTLREMSNQVGIPLSTLAKVEADKLSLTYDKLQQLAASLDLTLTEFLALGEDAAQQATPPMISGRRSVASNTNMVQVSTPNYDYRYLCADLRHKRMVPILVRIHTRDINEFGDLVRHQGEEFLYVLEGTVEVHLEFYTPVTLTVGQGIYLDSTMGHAYLAKNCESALVLAVCSSEDPNLATELISLTEGTRPIPVGAEEE